MGWLWGTNATPSPPPHDSGTDTDPLRDLDPNLRAFLDEETPPTQPPPPVPPAPSPPPPTQSDPPPKAPIPTLYPDGRYAHLWSTYRPLREVQLATQSDQEKVMEVIEGYKERKLQVQRTALENCAFEQTAVDKCFKTGGWKSRMTMCRAENKAVERCYVMNCRFLQALGYLTTADRSQDEPIQMHADTLYQRMLMQEQATQAAKAAGEAVPTFPPLLSSPSAQPPSSRPPPSSLPSPSEPFSPFSDPTPIAEPKPPTTAPISEDERDPLSPDARAALMERIKKLPTAEQREVEERAAVMEARAGMQTSIELARLHDTQIKERKERREKGQASLGDTINGWFGF